MKNHFRYVSKSLFYCVFQINPEWGAQRKKFMFAFLHNEILIFIGSIEFEKQNVSMETQLQKWVYVVYFYTMGFTFYNT